MLVGDRLDRITWTYNSKIYSRKHTAYLTIPRDHLFNTLSYITWVFGAVLSIFHVSNLSTRKLQSIDRSPDPVTLQYRGDPKASPTY
ncbi:hypothetical protein BJX63DRAFT_379783 [Aspergillus granulosus]|uniref:Uncharacterized protein n=1 Tax=Aspergillus granulosus TaxID=176169 RepID=A0ABR4HYR0_9EURO